MGGESSGIVYRVDVGGVATEKGKRRGTAWDDDRELERESERRRANKIIIIIKIKTTIAVKMIYAATAGCE